MTDHIRRRSYYIYKYMLVYGIPYATVFPCIYHTRLIFPYFSLFLLIILSKDEGFLSCCILKCYFLSCRGNITLQIFCHYAFTAQVLLWFKNGPWTSACESVLFVGCWVSCLVEWKITRHHSTERNITARYSEIPCHSPFVLPRREARGFIVSGMSAILCT